VSHLQITGIVQFLFQVLLLGVQGLGKELESFEKIRRSGTVLLQDASWSVGAAYFPPLALSSKPP
jgi:hypothetical protein